jgi:hypothetical protein
MAIIFRGHRDRHDFASGIPQTDFPVGVNGVLALAAWPLWRCAAYRQSTAFTFSTSVRAMPSHSRFDGENRDSGQANGPTE